MSDIYIIVTKMYYLMTLPFVKKAMKEEISDNS